MPSIRRADHRDAPALAEIAERTFRQAFGAMNKSEDMELHCRRHFGEAIQAAEIAEPAMLTLLSEHEGTLLGFAQLRWAAAPACLEATAPGEIYRLYVAADWQGKGPAADLMGAILRTMQRHGSDVAWLGVWERNPRAIAFYRRSGFVEVGEQPFRLGAELQRDLVMARAIPG
jgi:diamine N-acetyltransferase